VCVDRSSLVVVQCSDLLYKAHRSHSYEMVCGYKFFTGAPRQGHRRTRGGNVPSWRTLEGKLSNPRGRAPRARCMKFPPPENLRTPARAPRGAPCASFLPLESAIGGPWGAKRGAWWARLWHACGTPIWAWHVARRVRGLWVVYIGISYSVDFIWDFPIVIGKPIHFGDSLLDPPVLLPSPYHNP
jgi:hypothetical protein